MPTDLVQFTTATAATVLAVAGLVSLLKPYAEAWWLPPAAPLHDNTVRLLALAIGILVVVAATLVAPRAGGLSGPLILGAFVEGVKAGAGAIVTYHVVTSSLWDALTPTAAVEAPGALPPVPVPQSPASAPLAPPTQAGGQGGAIPGPIAPPV